MAFRFFMPNAVFHKSETIILVDDEYHHARHVLRLSENDIVYVLNGKGSCAKAIVCNVEKARIILKIQDIAMQEQPLHSTNLVLAHLRPGHLDFALEKCTELGIDKFLLYQADKSDRKDVSPNNWKRYEHLTTAAIKQSGRFFAPTITAVPSLATALTENSSPIIYCDLEPSAPYINDILAALPQSSITIVVGSESGFSPAEKSLLQQLGSPARLHENTLRAETAAMCASFAISLWRNRHS